MDIGSESNSWACCFAQNDSFVRNADVHGILPNDRTELIANDFELAINVSDAQKPDIAKTIRPPRAATRRCTARRALVSPERSCAGSFW